MQAKFESLQSDLIMIAKDVDRMEKRAKKQEQVGTSPIYPPPPRCNAQCLLMFRLAIDKELWGFKAKNAMPRTHDRWCIYVSPIEAVFWEM